MDNGDEFGRVDRVAGREDAAWEETKLEELCDRFVLGGPANQTLLMVMMMANDKPLDIANEHISNAPCRSAEEPGIFLLA